MSDVQRALGGSQNSEVVGECPVCANDGSYCPSPKCPMDTAKK